MNSSQWIDYSSLNYDRKKKENRLEFEEEFLEKDKKNDIETRSWTIKAKSNTNEKLSKNSGKKII